MRSGMWFFSLLIIVLELITGQGVAKANDVYIAQSAEGSANGSSCASPYAYTYFNTPGNWTSGTPSGAQIGPGTTVHLCGTFTASAGASGYLAFQGSGLASGQITVLFESGAVLTATYWGTIGAISGGGHSYIAVNGGTNGIIQATANGTGLAFQTNGAGINFNGSSNAEIKNLTIQNIYVHTCTPPTSTCTDESGQNTYGIYWLGGSNVSIDNNTLSNAGKWAIQYYYRTNTAVSIFNNTISGSDHGVVVGDAATNDVLSGSGCTNGVYNNDISNFQNWDDAAGYNHHDGVHTWANNAPGSHYTVCVYSNYIHGSFGATANAGIYMESDEVNSSIFNNIIVQNSSTGACASGMIGVATGSGSGGSGVLISNNTVVPYSDTSTCQIGLLVESTTSATMENNVVMSAENYVYAPTAGMFSTLNYNSYGTPAGNNPFFGPTGCASGSSFAEWQSPCGYDVNGQETSISLAGTYTPSSGSAIIGAGTNLTSLGITQLNTGAPQTFGVGGSCGSGCISRSSGAAWDAGAYEYAKGQPVEPTHLTAIVH